MSSGTAARALVIGLLVLVGAGHVRAAMVSELLVLGANELSDEDRMYIIDRNFKPGGVPAGQIDVGDSLRGHLNFNTLNSSSANLGGETPNSEFSGLYQLLVLSKTEIPNGFGGFNYRFTFGPDPVFEETWGTGAMLVLFEDIIHNFAGDFDDPTAGVLPPLDDGGQLTDLSVGPYLTEEAFIATASDGSRFWTLGFTSDVDGTGSSTAGTGQGWRALHFGSDNIDAAFGIPSGSVFGLHNWGLDRIVNGIPETGDPFIFADTAGPNGLSADFIGSTSMRGISDLDTAFEASSNTNIALTLVPEPTSLLLLAAGGLTILRRRR